MYQKTHLQDGINKYARLEKPPFNTLGDMACTRKNVNNSIQFNSLFLFFWHTSQ